MNKIILFKRKDLKILLNKKMFYSKNNIWIKHEDVNNIIEK